MPHSSSKHSISIANVVASASINTEIDLPELAKDLGNSNFDPENSPNLIYYIPVHESTAIITRRGKLISTGATSIESAIEAIEIVANQLRKLGFPLIFENIDTFINNIVAIGDLNQSINLGSASLILGIENTEYEPEQFPGLVYRPEESRCVLLVFASGKTVITGGQTVKEDQEAFTNLKEKVDQLL